MSEQQTTPEKPHLQENLASLFRSYDETYWRWSDIERDIQDYAAANYPDHDRISPEELDSTIDPFDGIGEFYVEWARYARNDNILDATNDVGSTVYEDMGGDIIKVSFYTRYGERAVFVKLDEDLSGEQIKDGDIFVGEYDSFNRYGEKDDTAPKQFLPKRKLSETEVLAIKTDLFRSIRRMQELIDVADEVNTALPDYNAALIRREVESKISGNTQRE